MGNAELRQLTEDKSQILSTLSYPFQNQAGLVERGSSHLFYFRLEGIFVSKYFAGVTKFFKNWHRRLKPRLHQRKPDGARVEAVGCVARNNLQVRCKSHISAPYKLDYRTHSALITGFFTECARCNGSFRKKNPVMKAPCVSPIQFDTPQPKGVGILNSSTDL